MTTDHHQKRIRAALAIVTDLAHQETLPDLGETELGRLIDDDELSDADLVLGLAQIAMFLLVKLEKDGYPMTTVLGDIGLRYGA